MHDLWLKPRLKGFAKQLGVEIRVTETLAEDGLITCELVGCPLTPATDQGRRPQGRRFFAIPG